MKYIKALLNISELVKASGISNTLCKVFVQPSCNWFNAVRKHKVLFLITILDRKIIFSLLTRV